MGKEIFSQLTAEKVGFDLEQEVVNTVRSLRDNPDAHREIAENAARQIRTYESETLEDSVASFYPYYIHLWNGEKKLFSADKCDKEFLVESQIDPLERDSAALDGFKKLQSKISEVDKRGFFLWISPGGKAGTEGIFKNIEYRYHQVYFGEMEGSTIGACALKCDIDESILATWLENISVGSIRVNDTSAKSFLLNPFVVSLASQTHSIEKALFTLHKILHTKGLTKFYKDIDINDLPLRLRIEKEKQKNDVWKIANDIDRRFIPIYRSPREEALQDIFGSHLLTLYLRYEDEDGSITLKGCSGGSIRINDLLGDTKLSQALQSSIFSTEFRLLSGSEKEDYSFDKKGTCVACGREDVYVGPCSICQPCDEKLKREEQQKAA